MKIRIMVASTCLIVSSILHSADEQGVYRISKSYRPENPPIIAPQPPQPIQRDYTFTEQLLKNEIRTCGISAVRERIQDAIRKTNAQKEGTAFMFIPFIAFNKTFYATATDPLSRSIFDKASRDGAQAGPSTPQPPTVEPNGRVIVHNKIYPLDDRTYYRVLDQNIQTIECITSIGDQDLIEKAIADVQQNG
jgi:hypothetical protein